MLDLNSSHLDTQVVELSVKLPLHSGRLLFDLFLHLVAINVVNIKEISARLVLSATYVLPHLFDLFKFFEKLVGQLSGLEDFVGSVGPDFFKLCLGYKNQSLQLGRLDIGKSDF